MKALTVFLMLLIMTTVPCIADTYEADAIPWSGYWWPNRYGGLATGTDYRGRPAPLEKYQMYLGGERAGAALGDYKRKYYDQDAPTWYGLCGFWALASAYEDIEFRPSVENNILFRVGDKKGLITLCHDDDMLAIGDGSNPEEFHYWLLNYIKDQKKAFVADLVSTTDEVWNYPIYKYDMSLSVSGDLSRSHVSVRIYFASDSVEADYIGTKVEFNDYTYDLLYNDQGSISGGEWTGGSIADHPQNMNITILPNTSITDLDYEEVIWLAQSRDDDLEGLPGPIELQSGLYNLVLMDQDQYQVDSMPGDEVMIKIVKLEGSLEDINIDIVNDQGTVIADTLLDDDNTSLTVRQTSVSPPFTITLSQNHYDDDPNVYQVIVDVTKSYEQRVLYLPKTNMWSGFVMTNAMTDDLDGVSLVTYSEDGLPVQTVLGPSTLISGERRVFLFDDLDWREHELADTEYLVLKADTSVNMINIFGEAQGAISGFVQGQSKGEHIVIADTAESFNFQKRMFGGLVNETRESLPITCAIYNADGTLKAEAEETLEPQGSFSITASAYPFSRMVNDGWIEVTAEETGQMLSGYHYVETAEGTDSLFAIPVRSNVQYVPHVPPPGNWATTLSLINPSDEPNTIRCHLDLAGDDESEDLILTLSPKEKRILEIQTLFGKTKEESLYHSILKITGESNFVGYFTYSTPAGGDFAGFALLDDSDFKSELVLAHYPSHHLWWTGFGIMNPATYNVTVQAEPYDQNGLLIAGAIKYFSLDGGAYDVLRVRDLFPETYPEIAFVKFKASNETDGLGGFFLYGNRDTGGNSFYRELYGAKF